MDGSILVVKHVQKEGPGLIAEAFDSYGWKLDVVELERGEPLPPTPGAAAGVILLGGPMNVYEEDDYPFLREEDGFIRAVIDEEIPFLGICLGAQLLAKACGATVTRAPLPEVGWYRVALTEAGKKDPVFRGASKNLPVFQWHGDTFDLPPGAVLLAEGQSCRNQAFRVGGCAYGIQFHIEVTQEIVDGWLRDETGIDVRRIRKEGDRIQESYIRQGALILRNFRRLVESSLRMKRVFRIFVEEKREPTPRLVWNAQSHNLVVAGQ